MYEQTDQVLNTLLISHFANNEIEAAAALIEKTQLEDQLGGRYRDLAKVVRSTLIEAVRQTNSDIDSGLLLPKDYYQAAAMQLQHRQVGNTPVLSVLRNLIAHRDAALADWEQLQKEPCREITIIVPQFLQSGETVWGVCRTHDYENVEVACSACGNKRVVTLLTEPPRQIVCPDCADMAKRTRCKRVDRWSVTPLYIDGVYVELTDGRASACIVIDPDPESDLGYEYYYKVPLSLKTDKVKGFRTSLECQNHSHKCRNHSQDTRHVQSNPFDVPPVVRIFATQMEAEQFAAAQQQVKGK